MTHPRDLKLLICADCGKVQYPDRKVCADCLGGKLTRETIDNGGELRSWTRLHASLEPIFHDHLPWVVVSVRLRAGPVVLAHWAGDEPQTGQPVKVAMTDDPAGRRVLVALDADADDNLADQLFATDSGHA